MKYEGAGGRDGGRGGGGVNPPSPEKTTLKKPSLIRVKQVPQNFMKAFNVDDITLTSHLMTSYRKINITSKKIVNYRVTSPSNHYCQVSFIFRERHFFCLSKASQ